MHYQVNTGTRKISTRLPRHSMRVGWCTPRTGLPHCCLRSGSLDDVAKANVLLTAADQGYLEMFEEIDVLIAPACAVSPFPHAQLSVTDIEGQPMPTYASWMALTYGLTLAAAPVCYIPCGRDATGMPFGSQIAGASGTDRRVLEIAHAMEQALADKPDTARPSPTMSAPGRRQA